MHYPSSTPVYIRPRSNKGWLVTIVVLLALMIVLQVCTGWLLIEVLRGLSDVIEIMVH